MVHSSTRYLAPERIGDLRVAERPQGRRNGSRLSLERSGSAADRSSVYRRVGRARLPGPVLPSRDANCGDGRRATWRRPRRGASGGETRRRSNCSIRSSSGRSPSERERPISPATGRRRWRCRWLAANSPPWNGPGSLIRTSSGRASRRPCTCSGLTSMARSPWSSSTGCSRARGPGCKRSTSFRTPRRSRLVINSGCSCTRPACRSPAPRLDCVSRSTKARETFDPGHSDTALDRMVLVGHSMGGLLSQDDGAGLTARHSGMPRSPFRATSSRVPRKSRNHSTKFSSSAHCPS